MNCPTLRLNYTKLQCLYSPAKQTNVCSFRFRITMTQTQFASDLKMTVKLDTHLFQVKSDVGVEEGPVKELHQSSSVHIH